jgi:3-hydroxyacyl-CoA dehydrogenase/3a,7a,12a-trihydroxy-5b-cholest-24-enoyl-CoA hydratase
LIPTAGSRMTQTILPEDLVEALKPEFVTPLCVYLGHESCTSTGQIYEAGAGWYGTVEFYRSKGLVIANASAEHVADNWEKICDMRGAKHFESSNEVMAELVNVLQGKNMSKL